MERYTRLSRLSWSTEGSADKRNIAGYTFKGVNQGGSPNTTKVDFYNPNNPIEENRWVRYGQAGVGEEYMEKATYVRLSNVALGYTFKNRGNKFIKVVKLSLIGQNLLLLTKYKGVDPTSTLFGYSMGSGLDLFNQPALRSYSFSLTLDL